MAGRVMHRHLVIAKRDRAAVVETIHGRRLFDAEAEEHAVLHGVLIQKQVFAVQIDGRAGFALGAGDARYVVHVPVGEQEVSDDQSFGDDEGQQLFRLVARIDVHRLSGALARKHVAILEERPGSRSFEDHGLMLFRNSFFVILYSLFAILFP